MELLRVFQYDVKCNLHSDSKAAIAASTAESGSWRTRHLRLRSSALREELRKGEEKWKLIHVRGEHLIADGWTKPLIGQAFDRFLRNLRMRFRKEDEVNEAAATTKGCEIAKVAAIGGALTMVACTGRSDSGWKKAVGLAAVAVLLWSWCKKQEADDPKRPAKRPHKDPNKIEERDQTILELDRSGTVTHVPGAGIPDSVENPNLGGNSLSSEVEGLMPGIRAFRLFGEPKSSSHGYQGAAAESSGSGCGSSDAAGAQNRHPRVSVEVDELATELEVKVRIPKDEERRGYRQAREEEACVDGREVTKGRATGRSVPAGKSDEPGRGHPTVAGQSSSTATAGDREESCPYMLPRFQAEPMGSADTWEEQWMESHGWLARINKKLRVSPFHPLHRSTPVGAESLTGRRVTKLFQNGRLVSIHVDDWRKPSSSRFDGVHGQWKGYTFF